jgi:hypothetical protein
MHVILSKFRALPGREAELDAQCEALTIEETLLGAIEA